MSAHSGSFVWFEHLSSDIAAAQAFYESLFGWQTETDGAADGGGDHHAIRNHGAVIGGYAMATAGAPNQWMSYLGVDDVDASYKAALAAGAQSLVAPLDIGATGRSATLTDPTGGVLSICKGEAAETTIDTETPLGGWFWNELTTQHDAAALAFYEKVFGFDHDTMPTPNGGNYHVLKQGGAMRAGIAQASDASMPTMWLQYVKVADCDASAAKAVQLGASVVVPPSEIPGIGRVAMFIDPQGAALAVMKSQREGGLR